MYKLFYKPSNDVKIECKEFNLHYHRFVKMGSVSPTSTYIIPEFTPISDQGSLNSCAANATADALEILKGIEDASKVVQVSRLFIYYNARAKEGGTAKDDGCYIHDALASLKVLGVCRESTWSYSVNNVFVHPTLEAYQEANDNTIADFYQITSTEDGRISDIETAIRANHPVIFGTEIGQEFEDYRGEDKIFDPPAKSIGGHAMIIVGVRINSLGKREFSIRNSWNTWGKDGHAWMSEEYIKWGMTSDLFVPTKMIDFTI